MVQRNIEVPVSRSFSFFAVLRGSRAISKPTAGPTPNAGTHQAPVEVGLNKRRQTSGFGQPTPLSQVVNLHHLELREYGLSGDSGRIRICVSTQFFLPCPQACESEILTYVSYSMVSQN